LHSAVIRIGASSARTAVATRQLGSKPIFLPDHHLQICEAQQRDSSSSTMAATGSENRCVLVHASSGAVRSSEDTITKGFNLTCSAGKTARVPR
jgi:hypothetical protein